MILFRDGATARRPRLIEGYDGGTHLAYPQSNIQATSGAVLNQDGNPFTVEVFLKTASFCAAVIYVVLFIGYRKYYNELGITPEDIGVGSAFVLVRSIGFIALVIGAVLLVGSIVNVLDSMSKDRKDPEKRKEDAKKLTENVNKRKEDAKARTQAKGGHNSCKSKCSERKIELSGWWELHRKSILRCLLLVGLAALLLGYLLALKPWSWPAWWIVVAWAALLFVAWVVERIAGRQKTAVGLSIAIAACILIAIVVPGLFVYIRAHDLADSAFRDPVVKGTPPRVSFPVVKPYSILDNSIPVLDVSSDDVDVEWICTDKNKMRPSVFDGRNMSTGELLGENPTSIFVRMDPQGKTPIVQLPAECVVTTRYEDTPLPQDADAQGFVGYPGGRCGDTDAAVALGRTAESLAVICARSDGSLYYVGFGLGNGLSVHVDKPLRYNDGYTVNNIDTQYTVTPGMLEIDQGSSVLTREPMIEYWSAGS